MAQAWPEGIDGLRFPGCPLRNHLVGTAGQQRAMPRKETPQTRADPTPGKMPVSGGERGQRRPAARRMNRRRVDEAALRDEDVQATR
jgi:hypothetical protein